MPEVEDFLPIFPEEGEESVMARMLVWLNDGVPTGDPEWVDPREGGIAQTLMTPVAREIATLYDRISVEFPAAASPLFAWGTYLDQWALVVGTERLDATYASGYVTFEGPEGMDVDVGTEVGIDPDLLAAGAEAPSYLTTAPATVDVGETDTGLVPVVATEAGVIGNRPADSVTFFLSEPPDALATVTNPDAIIGGTDEETDEALRERVLLIYGATPGGGNIADYEQWVGAIDGVGQVTIIPEGQGPGSVVVLAGDPAGDPVSDVTRVEIRDYLDPVAIEAVPSAVAATTITVPSTTGFRSMGIVHIGDPLLASERFHTYTGLSATQFTGVSPAPTLNSGDLVWQTGRGGGRSPVGHHVFVLAAVLYPVEISATVELDPGYSLEAGPTTISVGAVLTAAVKAYVDALGPGQEIVLYSVVSAAMSVVGVHDLTGVTINGTSANVTPSSNGLPVLRVTPPEDWPGWTEA